MKNFLIISALLLIAAAAIQADLLDCEEKAILKDIPIVGSQISSSGEHEMRDFFKNIGCKIKEGAEQVSDGAKKLGAKIGEKAKNLGSNIQSKYYDFKEKLSKDSAEEVTVPGHRLLRESVEIINPDILKAECGHGHILDALGNCSKLRK